MFGSSGLAMTPSHNAFAFRLSTHRCVALFPTSKRGAASQWRWLNRMRQSQNVSMRFAVARGPDTSSCRHVSILHKKPFLHPLKTENAVKSH